MPKCKLRLPLITHTRAKASIFQIEAAAEANLCKCDSCQRVWRILEAELTGEADLGISEQENSQWLHFYHFIQTGFSRQISEKSGSQQSLSFPCFSKFFPRWKEHCRAGALPSHWPEVKELAFSIWVIHIRRFLFDFSNIHFHLSKTKLGVKKCK